MASMALKCMILIVGILAGCATVGGAQTLHVTSQELSRHLAQQFPLERRWLQLVDVRLSDPRVTPQVQGQRLRADFDATVGDRVFRKRFRADLAVTAQLRYEPADHSFRLREVDVERFEVDGVDAGWLARVASLPGWLLGQGLEGAAVYRLSTIDVDRMRRAGLSVRTVQVTERGLEITLAPDGQGEDTSPSQRT